MSTPKIFESEYRFCLILWEHEPLPSAELAKLCKERLGWSRTTTYTVIHRLGERGIVKKRKRPRLLPRLQGRGAGGRAGRAGREDVRRLAPRVYRGVRAQDEAFAGRGRPAARHDRRL